MSQRAEGRLQATKDPISQARGAVSHISDSCDLDKPVFAHLALDVGVMMQDFAQVKENCWALVFDVDSLAYALDKLRAEHFIEDGGRQTENVR
jgi:hypothetical protein